MRKVRKGEIIELGFKMKDTGSSIVLKIVFKAIPSIKSTIFGTNNRGKKRRTNSAINPCANNIIETLPLGILSIRCV